MRALGALLVLAGAACCCLRRRRAGQLPIRVGRAVAADLAVLRYEICRRRAPLLASQMHVCFRRCHVFARSQRCIWPAVMAKRSFFHPVTQI